MDEITAHKRTSSINDKVAGSFTENVHQENVYRDDTSSIRRRNEIEERRRHIPEHLRVPVPENVGYSPKLANIGKSIGNVCMAVIAPIIKLLRFLQRRTNLTFWIITAMIIGVLIGQFAPAFGKEIKPLGDAFILMIKIIIVPLVFSVLVIGIAGHGDDIGQVGKLAIKTLIVSILY
jgi:proton glutamate symport protein